MTIIVSGRIYMAAESRDAFLADSLVAVHAARRAPGCNDFIVAADPVEPDRVNVYEEWDSEERLEAFRGEGPSGDMSAAIVRAEVSRHHVASSGPA